MARDFQKKAFYDWQHRVFSSTGKIRGEMSPEDCTALVEDVCRCYGLVVPQMIYPKGYQAKQSWYKPSPPSIILYKWARHRYMILHEVAHHIHRVLGGQADAGHGAEYCGIFLYLASEYMGYPLYQLFHRAEQSGLIVNKEYPLFKEKPNPDFVKSFQ